MHGTNYAVSRSDFIKKGEKIIRKEPAVLPSKEEILRTAMRTGKFLNLNEFIDLFILPESNYRKMFSQDNLTYVSPTLFKLFGYEGEPKVQRAAFCKFAKRNNINLTELTHTSPEIHKFEEIKKEIENEHNRGALATRKWIVMTARDIKTTMMKLSTKNGDMIRSYYADLEELMSVYVEYANIN
jgi:hypothetical protein